MTPKKWIASAPDHILQCRDLGHGWSQPTVARSATGYIRRSSCIDCGTIKEQHLDKKGYITGTRFWYPVGYRPPTGIRLNDKDSRAAIRLINIKRS